MKKIMLGFVALVMIVLAAYFLLHGNGDSDRNYKLVLVSRGDIVEKALAVGTIEPEKEIRVKSTIPGIVAEVMFKPGDLIDKGKPLFKISPNPNPLEYVETLRAMEVAEVSMKKLDNDRKRSLQLFKSDMISQSEMEAVEAAFNEANLKYKVARERFELMEKGRIHILEKDIDSIIKSPIRGIVLSQNVFQGDPVVPLTNFQPGTELCSMADMGKLLFKGTVDEIDVGKLRLQMPVEIQIGALPNELIKGKVERIYPKAKKDGNATLFDIEIVITDMGNVSLRAGYSANASIVVRERKGVLLIPERLVVFENNKKFVEIEAGQQIKKTEIQAGLSDGLNMEIIAGLKQGDQVIERPPREIQ